MTFQNHYEASPSKEIAIQWESVQADEITCFLYYNYLYLAVLPRAEANITRTWPVSSYANYTYCSILKNQTETIHVPEWGTYLRFSLCPWMKDLTMF